MISRELEERLWAYMGGIANENGMRAMTVGGVADHAHLLLSLPSTMSVAKAMQLIKGGSSKWIHESFPMHRSFAWQEGYGAFSIGVSQIDSTVRYIKNQPEHHRRRTFQDELIAFLKKHRIQYDPQYLWD